MIVINNSYVINNNHSDNTNSSIFVLLGYRTLFGCSINVSMFGLPFVIMNQSTIRDLHDVKKIDE